MQLNIPNYEIKSSCFNKKQVPKKNSMFLNLEMVLSILSYEQKTLFFMIKVLNSRKMILLIMFSVT